MAVHNAQQIMSDPTNHKKTFAYIAIGCGVFVLLMCLCGGAITWGCQSVFSTGREDAHVFLGDLRAEHYTDAWSRMSAAYQQTHDVAQFQAAVSTLPALTTHTDATFMSQHVNPGHVSLGGTLSTPTGAHIIEMVLLQETGQWRVDVIRVDEQTLP